MAYLMVKYQDPSTYALIDLSSSEFEIIGRALRELEDVYERMGAPDREMQVIQALTSMLERRYEEEWGEDSAAEQLERGPR